MQQTEQLSQLVRNVRQENEAIRQQQMQQLRQHLEKEKNEVGIVDRYAVCYLLSISMHSRSSFYLFI